MKTIIYILCAASLLSCTTLKVDLDILDRKKIAEDPNVTRLLLADNVAFFRSKMMSGYFEKVKSELNDELLKVYQELNNKGVVQNDDVKKYAKNDSENIVNKRIDQAVKLIADAIEAYDKAGIPQPKPKPGETPVAPVELATASSNFIDAITLLASIKTDLRKQTRDNVGASRMALLDGVYKKSNLDEKAAKLTSGRLEGDLIDDPLASLVVFVDDKLWSSADQKGMRKGQYSHAYAKTRWGNSDVAITMEGIGHYSIKGVKLDASKVAEASFKVLSQSIKLVGAIYGIETKKESGESDITTELNYKAKNDKEEKRLAAAKKNDEDSIIRILTTIATSPALTSDSLKKQSLKQINAAIDAYKVTGEDKGEKAGSDSSSSEGN